MKKNHVESFRNNIQMNKTILIYLILISFLSFYCADKAPEVKIINQSKDTIDVFFRNAECPSCPSQTFFDVIPFSETPYRECSISKYVIHIEINNNKVGSEYIFTPEVDRRFHIIIDTIFNFKVSIYNR